MESLWTVQLLHPLVGLATAAWGWLNSEMANLTRLCGYCAWIHGHGLGALGLGFGAGATVVGAAGSVGPGSDSGSNVGRNDSTKRGPGPPLPDPGGSNVGRNATTKAPDPWAGTGFEPLPEPTPRPIPDNRPPPDEWRNADPNWSVTQAREQQEYNEMQKDVQEHWDRVRDLLDIIIAE